MPEQDPDVLEVLIGQMAKDRDINSILGKAFDVSDIPSFLSQSAICSIPATSNLIVAKPSSSTTVRVYTDICDVALLAYAASTRSNFSKSNKRYLCGLRCKFCAFLSYLNIRKYKYGLLPFVAVPGR
jgi:hypothetical protein